MSWWPELGSVQKQTANSFGKGDLKRGQNRDYAIIPTYYVCPGL